MTTDIVFDRNFLPNTHHHFATVTNTPTGLDFIKTLRQSVRGSFKVRVRGRHSNRVALLGEKYDRVFRHRNEVPLAKAERLSIYMDPKK